jgi:hypothetical protein
LSNVFVVFNCPPDIEELFEDAKLVNPPLIVDDIPVTIFVLRPPIVAEAALAMLLSPPLTVELGELEVLLLPILCVEVTPPVAFVSKRLGNKTGPATKTLLAPTETDDPTKIFFIDRSSTNVVSA